MQAENVFHIPTSQGTIAVVLNWTAEIEMLRQYQAALRIYVATGDDCLLRSYAGDTVLAADGRHRLITDVRVLRRLAEVGELLFDWPARPPDERC